MDLNGGLAVLIAALILGGGIFAGIAFSGGTEIVEVPIPMVTEKVVEITKECPVTVCQEFEMPEIEVENADNALLNEFLESEFSVEYKEIENESEFYALEELEDHDYRVIVDYLKALLAEGEELDEDSVWVDIDDTDVKVTALGLEDDEDKSARVTFEVEVEYELEEGVRDEFEMDLVVVYDVLFDEGDFSDEEVELISIV